MPKSILRTVASTSLVFLSSAALAYDLPGLNLGNTSFYDGSPAPAGPGWYLEEYLNYSKASRFNDANGDKLQLPRQDVDALAVTTQIIYVGQPLANGAMPGITVINTSLAHVGVDDGLDNSALSSRAGFGDVVIGPYLQLPTLTRADGSPLLTQRVEADVSVPVGAYNRNRSINPGSNFWSFNPYYAATYWFSPKWSASGRFMYLWNGKNDDPQAGFGSVSDTQAGQALHANLTLQYAVTEQLSVGLNGYWLKQFTDTQVGGHDVSGRKEKVWAIGPGVLYSFNKENVLTVNSYFEQGAENRTEGNKLVLNFLHKL
ncbi:transporter [Pseudomonas tremae]|uniref:Signal peptide protein n=2 Tax=Pseudomonas syringae group TaxID=136849 RepID=A0AA40P0C5_9PSED|nr:MULTISPECIES: transporter [Pseudomonas syringae group]KPB49704.1 putative signal peptide protein [Pseudomonas coronafaciens pv. oryzae]KPY04336.1 putative signal peptide protein [Pseudomonas coronafaciens pv. oryzae]KPY92223.1 putative signal peptide protein [Pseudomonas tremae]KPZ25531.1 putative signal peptide protein [Pseudomonas coronafaciens pv. zizaniae]MCQ3014288.1 transporter [Pseudomonas tremae]